MKTKPQFKDYGYGIHFGILDMTTGGMNLFGMTYREFKHLRPRVDCITTYVDPEGDTWILLCF